MPSTFPTFCHLSQYGDWGYRSLARMLTISDPLILWAPSSASLRSTESSITADEFLHFVKNGKIHVVAREEWLEGPGYRNPDRWPGAGWDPEIDGLLRDLRDEDRQKALSARRVTAAPPETGYAWATDYFKEHPEEISKWVRRIKSRNAPRYLPSETLNAARTVLHDPTKAVVRVLRDAHNHGVAYRNSEADAPFLLDGTDRRFIKVLSTVPASASTPSATVGPRLADSDALQVGELVTQLVEILERLDVHAGRPMEHRDLKDFMEGEGHAELAAWMKRLCNHVKEHPTREIDDYVVDLLRQELRDSRLHGLLSSLRYKKDDFAVGLSGAVTSIIGMIADPLGPANVIGAVVTAYPVGKGLIREIGYAPAAFEGPQWPFLYTYGRRARKRDISRITFVLDVKPD